MLWHSDELLTELDSTGTQRIGEYVYYPGIDRPLALITGTGSGSIRYFTQDRLGNVTGVVTGSSIAQSVLYDAWGRQTVSGNLGDTNRLRWKGLVWDGDVTQLYFMRNRWYEPQTGRFLSEDPIGLEGGVNQYAFGAGDPTNSIDPSGLNHCLLKDFIKDLCTPELDPIQVTAPADPWWGNDPAESGYWPYGPGPGSPGGGGGGASAGRDCRGFTQDQCGRILDAINQLRASPIQACRNLGERAMLRFHDPVNAFVNGGNRYPNAFGWWGPRTPGLIFLNPALAFLAGELGNTTAHEESHASWNTNDQRNPAAPDYRNSGHRYGDMCDGPI